MMNAKTSALGIIFPNIYDELVPELTRERLMGSIPFGGRYRMVDFMLSSMVNSGIDNIAMMVNANYHSLVDHIGSGREWDLVRKSGGITLFPPYAQKNMGPNGSKVIALDGILRFLKTQKENYVVMTDTNIAYNIDFNKIIAEHIASEADITVLYKKEAIPVCMKKADGAAKGFYDTLVIGEDNRVTEVVLDNKEDGPQNFGMNVYVLGRELLIKLVEKSSLHGGQYFERDILASNVDTLNIKAYEYEGYTARIAGIHSYFHANMALLDDENLDALFGPAPVFTKIRDDNPTRYIGDAKATNALVADGCTIEGEVENSILFRGVKIGKGAKVKNCILMQDTVVEADASIEYMITDKKVTITAGKSMKGESSYPLLIQKSDRV